MEVRIFNYREPGLVARDTETVVDRLAPRIFADWESTGPDFQSDSCFPLQVSVVELDGRAQLHCDKWIEETALHMSLYSAAQQQTSMPNIASPANVAGQRHVLKYKSFSGDVSGVIGEALFSLILVKHFRITDLSFAHFRADKTSGLYPDFGIYEVNNQLRSELNWDYRSAIILPVPVEVKSMTSPTHAIVKERLSKAVEQIKNFWAKAKEPSGASIICIVIRNQNLSSYDVALIWGR